MEFTIAPKKLEPDWDSGLLACDDNNGNNSDNDSAGESVLGLSEVIVFKAPMAFNNPFADISLDGADNLQRFMAANSDEVFSMV